MSREWNLLGFTGFYLCSKVSLPALYRPGHIIKHFIWEWFWFHIGIFDSFISLIFSFRCSDFVRQFPQLPSSAEGTVGSQDVEKAENSLRGEFFMQSTLSLGTFLQSHSNCSARLWLSPNLTLRCRLHPRPRTPGITQMKKFTGESYSCSLIRPLW